jgi:hypothetical protein
MGRSTDYKLASSGKRTQVILRACVESPETWMSMR